ncbi:serine/threonine-protein kinase [Streptomyces montanus]|uniref:Serine/threonine-protein kinase n=1 Tax=Streptomyces montanus TaxID=2580423 RepID=A0A5R9FXN1_9ACTN|nr:serine/threonine-protein kinase [Streptomyces montanus]TLS44235.1 serine/threonine-protein kinase [Streptomyces montanus]
MVLRAGDPGSIGGYTLEDRLGSGGMGTVYLARSESGRRIALKLVHQQFADDDEFRVRFQQEVSAARRVSGAFTAAVVDADPDAPLPWMATSYVPGPTLAERVAADGPLSSAELRQLAIGLAEALRDIHRVGVVHRDLKPANIVLSEEGPRVIDFGISRAADNKTLTMTGRVMGTPPFMSPEQLNTPREVGPESDVFSLAAVLVFAAMGRSPFDADSPYMTAYQVVHEPPELEGVTEPLRGIAADCLGKEPATRPGLDRLLERLRTLPAADDGRDGHCGDGDSSDGDSSDGDSADFLAAGRTPRQGWPVGVRRALVMGGTVAGLAGAIIGAIAAFGPTDRPKVAREERPTTVAASLPPGWSAWHRRLPESSSGVVPGDLGPINVASSTGDRCLRSGSGLYCGGQGVALTRLDAATGRPVWPDPPNETITDIIGVSDGFVQAVTEVNDGEKTRLAGYRLSDGKQEWWTDIGGAYQGTTFVRGRGHAVLVQDWDAETFQAVDARTGDIKWSKRVSDQLTCRPTVQNGHPYAECGPLDSLSSEPTELYALDPGSGEPKRIFSLPSSAYFLGTRGSESLYVEDGGKDSPAYTTLLFVDRDSGAKRRVKLSPSIPNEAVVPSLVGDTLYFVRQNGEVTAATTGGKRLWTKATGVEWLSAPAVSGRRGALYLAAASGRVVALDRTDGRVLWREKPRTDPGGNRADVALIGDALYVMYGYDTAEVFSIDVTGSRRLPGGG